MALPPGERTAFLNEACAGDAELQAAVERLLDFHDSDFLEDSALAAASGLLADPDFQPGQIIGRTPYLQLVHAEAEAQLIGKIVPVKMASATQLSLAGVIEAT